MNLVCLFHVLFLFCFLSNQFDLVRNLVKIQNMYCSSSGELSLAIFEFMCWAADRFIKWKKIMSFNSSYVPNIRYIHTKILILAVVWCKKTVGHLWDVQHAMYSRIPKTVTKQTGPILIGPIFFKNWNLRIGVSNSQVCVIWHKKVLRS